MGEQDFGAAARRSGGVLTFNHFLMLRGPNPVCRAMSPMEVSGLPQTMDLIKDGLPRATMRLAGEVSMFCDFASATRTICDHHDVFIVGFRQQSSAR